MDSEIVIVGHPDREIPEEFKNIIRQEFEDWVNREKNEHKLCRKKEKILMEER